MRILVSVIDHETGGASAQEIVAIDAFNVRLRAEGRLVLACGISDPSEARVVDGRGDQEPVFAEGPLHDTKEYVSGFWVLDVGEVTDGEMIAVAAEASRACNRRVEVRRLH